MRIRCRLDDIMKERTDLTNQDLAELAGIYPGSIANLRKGTWSGITKAVLGRLCAALDIQIAELFEVVPADIWYPIRQHGRVTVHLGSTSFSSGNGAAHGGAYIDRQGIGTWDVRSLFHVNDHLNRSSLGGVVFDYTEHIDSLHDAARVEELFRKGNHLILGSPIVNPMAEDAVCHGFSVDPRSSRPSEVFPHRFRWDRTCESSFGEHTRCANELGIVRPGSPGLVARRTVVEEGVGEDCGLIFTYRFNPEGRQGDGASASEDDDFIVIAIMGHSGCGTLAGTQLACTDDAAQALYPTTRNAGNLRAFSATYKRPRTTSGFDNREVIASALVPTG